MRFGQGQIVTNGDMDSAIESAPIDVNQIALLAIQAVWTGAGAAGTLKLQISTDPNLGQIPATSNPEPVITNWTDYTGSTTTVAGPGDFVWNCVYAGYHYVRVVFTPDGGGSSGNLNVRFSSKG